MRTNPYTIGQLLFQFGVLDQKGIEKIKAEQSRLASEGVEKKFGEVAIWLGLATDVEVSRAIAEQDRLCLKDSCKAQDTMDALRAEFAAAFH